MDTANYLDAERAALERARLHADPDARFAALEARVEELTRQVAVLQTVDPRGYWIASTGSVRLLGASA